MPAAVDRDCILYWYWTVFYMMYQLVNYHYIYSVIKKYS